MIMMEAARTSETSVDNYFTRQYIPEDNSELHTRRREILKSHIDEISLHKVSSELTLGSHLAALRIVITSLHEMYETIVL
jgi:hypothetical protein